MLVGKCSWFYFKGRGFGSQGPTHFCSEGEEGIVMLPSPTAYLHREWFWKPSDIRKRKTGHPVADGSKARLVGKKARLQDSSNNGKGYSILGRRDVRLLISLISTIGYTDVRLHVEVPLWLGIGIIESIATYRSLRIETVTDALAWLMRAAVGHCELIAWWLKVSRQLHSKKLWVRRHKPPIYQGSPSGGP